jgi:hypothetical protein
MPHLILADALSDRSRYYIKFNVVLHEEKPDGAPRTREHLVILGALGEAVLPG